MLFPEIPQYLFLPEDLAALRARMAKIASDIQELQETMAESTRQSSETWHDNFMFEEGNRQMDVFHKELEQLSHVASYAHLVESNDPENLIGKTIRYRDLTSGSEHEVILGSYLLLAPRQKTASYNSPLGKIFMQAQHDKVISGMIGDELRSFMILDIA